MAMFYGWVPRRSTKQPKQAAFKPMKKGLPVNPRLVEHQAMMKECPSVGPAVGIAATPLPKRYEDPELAAREEAARQVKHTIAPICNKGGYQVITNEADIKTAGRKV